MKTLTFVLFIFSLIGNYAVANSSVERNSVDNSDEDLKIEKRIFGGLAATRDEYTYVAKLSINFQQPVRIICSGVALTTKIILTVAQCVSSPEGEIATSVRASFTRGGLYVFENRRKEIFVHPGYDGLFSSNIAILKKDWPRDYMIGLDTATLPTIPASGNTEDYTNVNVIIAGWGRNTEASLSYSLNLQYGTATLMNTATCSGPYYTALRPINELLCTSTNIAGICLGDYGGPLLVVTNNNRRPLLLGLSVLRRSTCNNRDFTIPSAYYDLRPVGSEWLRNNFSDIF